MRGRSQSVVVAGLTLGCLLALSTPLRAQCDSAGGECAAAALRDAVAQRLDGRAEVQVSDVMVRFAITSVQPSGAASSTGIAHVKAALEPNQRLGRPLQFVLYDASPGASRRAIGAAQARVHVRMPVVRVARDVERGAVIGIADVAEVWDEPAGLAVRAVPTLTQVVGAQATRDLKIGTLVTGVMTRQLPVVRQGDEVTARATVGGIEVLGKAIAHQAGRVGQVIRVANADSGRKLRARVVGPREVEVEYVR